MEMSNPFQPVSKREISDVAVPKSFRHPGYVAATSRRAGTQGRGEEFGCLRTPHTPCPPPQGRASPRLLGFGIQETCRIGRSMRVAFPEKLARKEAHTTRRPCHALNSSFSWCCKSQLCMACLSVCLSAFFFWPFGNFKPQKTMLLKKVTSISQPWGPGLVRGAALAPTADPSHW